MCGLLGRIQVGAGDPAARVPIERGLMFLGRRGPDSHASWSSRDGTVELLHARLAIVDTDPQARQPFTSPDGEIALVFNGEIYNYEELREELPGYPFRTRSDTEVVLALYRQHGAEGLRRLRGMFALCIVDQGAKRVLLLRDPVGKKPLFLARWGDGVFFGSTVVAMAATSRTRPALEHGLLPEYFRSGHAHPLRSLLRDCAPVLPGELLELDWTGACVRRATCADDPPSLAPASELPRVLSEVDGLLERAVRRRLTNNPHPVCLLSGGIDSTVVAMHLKRQGVADAITLGSLVPGELDEKYAREAARRLEIPLRVVRARPGRMADEACWALDLQDEPLGIMAFFPLALMVRRSKEYGKILLTGDGGDEVFLGYGRPDEWLAPPGTGAALVEGARPFAGCPPPAWMSRWGCDTVGPTLIGHMFTKLDRATAEQGVEARCPLLDWDLICYARKLPPSLLFHRGRTKALLKAQLHGWPAAFVDRKKIGFAFRLRWIWALSGFAGLRDLVSRDAIAAFEPWLPAALRAPPSRWTALAILRNFGDVWKLLAWSRFERRLSQAANG